MPTLRIFLLLCVFLYLDSSSRSDWIWGNDWVTFEWKWKNCQGNVEFGALSPEKHWFLFNFRPKMHCFLWFFLLAWTLQASKSCDYEYNILAKSWWFGFFFFFASLKMLIHHGKPKCMWYNRQYYKRITCTITVYTRMKL